MKRKTVFILTVLFALFLFNSPESVYASENSENEVKTELGEEIEKMIDEIDLSVFDEYLSDLYSSVGVKYDVKTVIKNLVSGRTYLDYRDLGSFLFNAIFYGIKQKFPQFISVFLLIVACAVINAIKPERLGGGIYELSYFAIFTALVCSVTAVALSAVSVASETLAKIGKATEAVTPVLLSVMAASGNANSAAVFSPAFLFVTDFIIALFKTVVFPVISTIVAMSVVSNINGSIKLKGFISFLSGCLKWLIGLTIAVFSVFLTIKGLNSGIFDGIYARALKYTVNSSVPIVGGMLKDGLEVIYACAILLKNALGAVSVFIIFGIIINPILDIAAISLSMKLLAAVSEPLGDGRPSAFISSVGSALNFSLAAIIIVSLALVLTIILAIGSTGLAV
ncbi:MAG TPA: hypothetical protein DDW54_01265 [Clostridiales bacterium]|nr:hypothetical protein [Clostridiales bacterium]